MFKNSTSRHVPIHSADIYPKVHTPCQSKIFKIDKAMHTSFLVYTKVQNIQRINLVAKLFLVKRDTMQRHVNAATAVATEINHRPAVPSDSNYWCKDHTQSVVTDCVLRSSSASEIGRLRIADTISSVLDFITLLVGMRWIG